MKFNTGNISGYQLMFSIACFLQGSILLTNLIAPITKQDSWMVMIIGYLLTLPIIAVYLALLKDFPGLNLAQINNKVFGPVLGRIISLIYLWFFVTVAALNADYLGDYTKIAILSKTPKVVIIIAFIAVCAWAVHQGLQIITQPAAMVFLGALTLIIISIVLTVNHINVENFLPILDQPVKSYIQGINIITTIPFCEIIVYMMIAHKVKNPAHRKKAFFLGFTIGSGIMLFVLLKDIAVLGNTLSIFSLPPIESLRMVSISDALSRMEVLFTLSILLFSHYKVTVLLYVSMVMFAEIFGLKDYRHFVLVIAAFIVSYALFAYASLVENSSDATNIIPIIWIPIEIILPLLTLAFAKMQKRWDKKVVAETP